MKPSDPKTPLWPFRAGGDITHHSAYGAYELAKCVVEGVRANGLGLAQDIVADYRAFDPAHPDPPGAFDVPVNPTRSSAAPRGK